MPAEAGRYKCRTAWLLSIRERLGFYLFFFGVIDACVAAGASGFVYYRSSDRVNRLDRHA
jgi:hypothetical protein